MRIRLSVLVSRGGRAAPPACDVLVTAPAGTVLATVTDALTTTAAAAGTLAGTEQGGHETVPVYVGAERLDPQRQVLGTPPLIDGAVLSLYGPSTGFTVPAHGPSSGPATLARLHVVAGPDAGGIHLLSGGRVTLGRSADADVPLDDPDVSRLHCAVVVADDGSVTVGDLGSTNGTTVGDTPVRDRPVPLPPGTTLRLGESVVQLEAVAPGDRPLTLAAEPDGQGHLRLTPAPPRRPADDHQPQAGGQRAAQEHARSDPAPGTLPQHPEGLPPSAVASPLAGPVAGLTAADWEETAIQRRRVRGIGAWARRLTEPRDEARDGPQDGLPNGPRESGHVAAAPGVGGYASGSPAPAAHARHEDGFPANTTPEAAPPDLSTVLLSALGPGPLLWQRDPDGRGALTMRLGSAHGGHGRGEDGLGRPVVVDLRETGSLGLAGPRSRLAALTRSLLAQLCVRHPPGDLELVLLTADAGRAEADRVAEWSWLGWLPQLHPAHGQDCRLLVAYDHEQAAARTAELTRRLEEIPTRGGPRTVVVVDGDPGGTDTREQVARLAREGAATGIHVMCLAETPPATPASPLDATLEAAYLASPPFRACGTVALLSGAVATAVRVVRGNTSTVATMDGVSAAWAERFARALAPLREPERAASDDADAPRWPSATKALPRNCRLLDELGLERPTPASVRSRWSRTPADGHRASRSGAGAPLVLGVGTHGRLSADLAAIDEGHVLVTGATGSGKTELLRSVAASLAAGERPERLALLLVDGDGQARGGGLEACADLPHVETRLVAGEPVRMREFARWLHEELKRRVELFDEAGGYEAYVSRWSSRAARVVAPRRSTQAAPLDESEPTPPRRLVVVVDDLDVLVDPALGNPGRPAAGSLVRVMETIARDGARLGAHLVAASGRPDRTRGSAAERAAAIRVELTGRDGAEAAPGRGTVALPGQDTATPFQAARVTGRIPRTSTLRPTVTPLDWARAGDPPTRRPVRELGNGPTDLALLASAMGRTTRTSTEPAADAAARARGRDAEAPNAPVPRASDQRRTSS